MIAQLAQAVLATDGPIDWQSMERTHRIREAIGKVVPGYGKIAAIDDTKEEFQIDGRTFHAPRFPTPSAAKPPCTAISCRISKGTIGSCG